MDRDAIESMQGNLSRGEPAIMASYALIGAIMLLGGAGWARTDTSAQSPGVCWQG